MAVGSAPCSAQCYKKTARIDSEAPLFANGLGRDSKSKGDTISIKKDQKDLSFSLSLSLSF